MKVDITAAVPSGDELVVEARRIEADIDQLTRRRLWVVVAGVLAVVDSLDSGRTARAPIMALLLAALTTWMVVRAEVNELLVEGAAAVAMAAVVMAAWLPWLVVAEMLAPVVGVAALSAGLVTAATLAVARGMTSRLVDLRANLAFLYAIAADACPQRGGRGGLRLSAPGY